MPPVSPTVPPPVPQEWQLTLVGEHNKENASLAALALRMLGLSDVQIKEGLETFEAVEGRLQKVAEINRVTFYNDNNATTPEATIAALNSFPKDKVILIAGGSDKNLDTSTFVQEMSTCKKVLLLAGTGTDVIKTHLPGTMIYHSVVEAVNAAFEEAQAGDTILFSPGFASFGMFKNEYDRNDQFVAAVKSIQSAK